MEYAQNSINIDNPHPWFSWIISSAERNQHQSAYRIFVSSDRSTLYNNIGDFWDSGKIISSETIQHALEKDGIGSNRKYYWRVVIWDANDEIVESPVAPFETALLHPGDWKAKWIGNGPAEEPLPAKGFYGNVKEQEGREDTVVHPYKKSWKQYRMQWFGHKKAIAQIEVTYTDGSTQTITTDESWRWSDGPVTYGCIYDGEIYNANLEQPGWTMAGFDDSNWKPVNIIQPGKAKLVSQTMPAIKVIQTIQPKEIKGGKS